jgi:type IV pilus assembly protein PilC
MKRKIDPITGEVLLPERTLFGGDVMGGLKSFFGGKKAKHVKSSSEKPNAQKKRHTKRRKHVRHAKKPVRQAVAAPEARKSVVADDMLQPQKPTFAPAAGRLKSVPKPADPKAAAPIVRQEAEEQPEAGVVEPAVASPDVGPSKTDIVDAEEAWLAKTLRKDTGPKAEKKSGWAMLRGMLPFGGDDVKKDAFLSKTVKEPVKSAPGMEIDAKALADDPFLQKVIGKEEAKGGVFVKDAASKEDVQELKEELTKQDKLAKKREEAFEKELERQKKELAQRKTVAKEEETPMPAAGKLAKEPEAKGKVVAAPEAAKASERPVIIRKKAGAAPGGFQAFLAAISHIGLGKERTMFIQNLGTMLGAGLTLIESLHTLQKESRAKPMKKIIRNIIDAVENGYPLWRAMQQQSFFSPHALALVRIGEEAGNLAENVVYLAEQEEKDNALRGKVKMAMIYPSIVMVLMFVIVVGLGWFVLPQLIGVLTSLDVELPLSTRMIILFTKLFTEYGLIFVPSCIGFFITIILLSKFTNFRVVTQWFMFRIPGIGQLARQATIARFGVILGGLLKAGVPVVEAMQSLVEVTPIMSYKRLYAKMLEHIIVGDSFAKTFTLIKHCEKLLPPSVQQLVITGERSGALADITLKIADIYDKKASDTAQKLPVILEPMLLLFIGALVGTIAFSIIVPIYGIVGNVGGQ